MKFCTEVVFILRSTKLVSMFGVSIRLTPRDGGAGGGRDYKKRQYGSPCTKSTLNEVLTDMYSAIRSSAFIE